MLRQLPSQTELHRILSYEDKTGVLIWKLRVERHIGCFATAEQASAARELVARELHGEFARTK